MATPSGPDHLRSSGESYVQHIGEPPRESCHSRPLNVNSNLTPVQVHPGIKARSTAKDQVSHDSRTLDAKSNLTLVQVHPKERARNRMGRTRTRTRSPSRKLSNLL